MSREADSPGRGAASASSPLEAYALIGDPHSAALVCRDGSLDWLCLPRFDSPACFAALLGDGRNGRWQRGHRPSVTRTTRRYRGDTLILETDFETDDGTVRLVDCMPPAPASSARGPPWSSACAARSPCSMDLRSASTTAASSPWVRSGGRHAGPPSPGPDALEIRADVAARGRGPRAHRRFRRRGGASASAFVPDVAPVVRALRRRPSTPCGAIADTEAWWTRVVGALHLRGAVARAR